MKKLLSKQNHEPMLEWVPTDKEDSYSVKHVDKPSFNVPWHRHPELELMLILEGEGIRYVGDHEEEYGPGDLVLIGSDLLHVWQSSSRHDEGDPNLRARAHIIYIQGDHYTMDKRPEMLPIQTLLREAQRGIRFNRETQLLVADKIAKVVKAKIELQDDRPQDGRPDDPRRSSKRLLTSLTFLDILNDLAISQDKTLLASLDYKQPKYGDRRLDNALGYLHSKYLNNGHANRTDGNPLELNKIAERANMTPVAFCRYFKIMHNRTVFAYINDLRVVEATRLLIDTSMKISEIGEECGFNSVSNFYEQFEARKGCSPSQYRDRHQRKQASETAVQM